MSTPNCDRRLLAVLEADPQPKEKLLKEEEVFEEIQRLAALPDTQKLARQKRLCDADLADAASKCFLSLRRNLARLDPEKNWSGYVRTSLHNAVRDVSRAAVRRRTWSLELDEDSRQEPVAPEASPLKELMEREQVEVVLTELLAGASERDRVIVERYLGGQTYAAIAADTGISISAVCRVWCKFVKMARERGE